MKIHTKLSCICGKSFSRKVRDGQVYACSRECRRKLLDKIGYQCAICRERLPANKFRWYDDARYHIGKKRCGYCLDCEQERNREYNDSHHEENRKSQSRYRERCLSAGTDEALLWYLKRRLGAYRKTSSELGVECDFDANYLLDLFHKQDGKCYYTQEIMEWNNYGKGKGHQRQSTLSVDRLTPTLGYVRGNIVLCSHLSNTSKGARTEDEFYAFCEKVISVRSERNIGNL